MSDTGVSVLGLHPVLGVPGCFLLEVEIVGASEPPDFGLFVQAAPGSPPSNWQVAWDERLLDPTGSVVVASCGPLRSPRHGRSVPALRSSCTTWTSRSL